MPWPPRRSCCPGATRSGRRSATRRFWADHYLGYLSARPDSVSAALRVVADAEGAAVVHCAAGKDRTGTVVAMALDVAGVPHEEIVADYVLTAERIEQIIGRLMPRPAYGQALAKQSIDEQVPQGRVDRGDPDARRRGLGRRGRVAARPRLERRRRSSASAAGSPSRLLADVDRDDALDDHRCRRCAPP